jgi:hypothetical protein
MSVLERKPCQTVTDVAFVLAADNPPGPVSVVGDFNDWTPGAQELRERPRDDCGRRRPACWPASRTPSATRHRGYHWFDDEHADAPDGRNGHIHT